MFIKVFLFQALKYREVLRDTGTRCRVIEIDIEIVRHTVRAR